jgi:alpha-tubulin suppressor-like RCC1 family protein
MKPIKIIFILLLSFNLIFINNCQQAGSSGGGGGGGSSDGGEKSNLRVIRVSAGVAHSVALINNGKVKCWGLNDFGQLGYGDIEDRGDEPGEMGSNLPFVDLGTGIQADKIASGYRHNIVRFSDGSIKCWGQNECGQLGYGDTNSRGDNPGEMGNNLPVVDLGTGKKVYQIACGNSHTVALLTNFKVKCWGNNDCGQLGYGDTEDRGDEPGEMGSSLPFVSLW